MRVLILGGNGFIGQEVCRALSARGHDVSALARDTTRSALRTPEITWIRRDLRAMREKQDWSLLTGFDAVVNCAGALQDGARDDVRAVQETAMLALYEAAEAADVRLIVQISARTDGPGARRDFLASKRTADEALKRSGVPFVILRPAVVIGRNAHGGSALLRALATVPWRTPLVHPDASMQFVGLSDVAEAISDALEGRIAAGSDLSLNAPEVLPLRKVVALHRAWLGLPRVPTIAIPAWAAAPLAFLADLLGRLGWRSPLRSTAMEIAGGGAVAAAGGTGTASRVASLSEILARSPAGVQDLWFARLYLLKPVIFAALSLFWLLSGAIALLRFGQSSGMLVDATGAPLLSTTLTVATSFADILLGGAVLVRRYARSALIGMILVSLAYIAAATMLVPHLWADPLGPLVKVFPSLILAAVALAILDER